VDLEVCGDSGLVDVSFYVRLYPIGRDLGVGPTPEEVASLTLPVFSDDLNPSMSVPLGEGSKHSDSHSSEKQGDGRARQSTEGSPFVLSEALPVVPGKLVQRIQRGEFVDMADLLKDNVEAERRRLAAGDGKAGRLGRREVPDIESWLQCFSAYAAVVCAKFPRKARELWAYQAFIIAEHRKCGGRGWLLYDSAFRQQIASLDEADFSRVNQGLYATTFLAYGGKGLFCTRCMASDHAQDECALHPNREVPVVQIQERAGRWRKDEALGEARRRRGRRGACYAYNEGRCSLPYCRFDHVCSTCGGDHRRTSCRGRGAERQRAPERGGPVVTSQEGGVEPRRFM